MKLAVARKLATPIPLKAVHGKGTCFHEGNIDSLVERGCGGGEFFEATVAELWPTTPISNAKATCALLAHCYNHFDELVAVLKRVHCHPLPRDVELQVEQVLKSAQEIK